MRFTAFLSLVLLPVASSFAAGNRPVESSPEVLAGFHREAAPLASDVAKSLVWIADAKKMDEFLAQRNPVEVHGTRAYEVLPDTRGVWREYARQAWAYAERGDDEGVINRVSQMLKLAALYREFGGLQNVVQAEEIRYLAGRTVQQLGYGGHFKSQYLETSPRDCLAEIQRLAGDERGEVTPEFWQHLLAVAQQSFLRLAGQPTHPVAMTGSVSSR
jgi:hypothetical protein